MRVHTPRATPIVNGPTTSAVIPVTEAVAAVLRPPVTLITPAGELELREGALVIGRLAECDLVLHDSLVSRMHARLILRDEGVVVEDLRSTNGVFVNDVKVTHAALLHEGDRVLIGTTELSVFEGRPTPMAVPRREPSQPVRAVSVPPLSAANTSVPARLEPTARLAPSTLPAERGSGAEESDPSSSSQTRLVAAAPADANSVAVSAPRYVPPSAARGEPLEVVGAVAERLALGGNVAEAVRLLSVHLRRVLEGVMAGLIAPPELCELSTRHALSMARWTADGAWLDYVVRLHWAAKRIMSRAAFTSFECVALERGGFDRGLLVFYSQSLGVDEVSLGDAERLVLKRLRALADVRIATR